MSDQPEEDHLCYDPNPSTCDQETTTERELVQPGEADINALEKAAWGSKTDHVLVWYRDRRDQAIRRMREADRSSKLDRVRAIRAEAEVQRLTAQLAEKEQRVIEDVEGHWFIQGGKMQFHDDRMLPKAQNADELIANILSVVRQTTDRLEATLTEQAREIAHLKADQQDWRKGVALIASYLGDPADNLSCVRIAEVALQQRAKLESAEAALLASQQAQESVRAAARAVVDAWLDEHFGKTRRAL